MLRIITRVIFLLALVGVQLLALAVTQLQAEAQTNTVTSRSPVSNIDETTTAYKDMNLEHAQSFRTGDRSDGYVVTSVDLDLTIAAGHSSFTATIHGDGADPGAGVALSDAPETLATGVNEFTPTDRLVMEPSSRYWVVVDAATGGTRTAASVAFTTSDDDTVEDEPVILNGSRNRGYQSQNRQRSGDAEQVRVKGLNNVKPKWVGDGFQLINVFRQNEPAALLLPAATGEGPLIYNLLDTPNNNLGPLPTTLTLPDGLKFDPVSRMIYGTPTTVESDAYTYSVTDRHGQQKKFQFLIGVKAAPEWASLSVLPGPDVLHVVWTPTADPEATGYLVQWKSGDQEFSDTERRHTTGSDASSYKIANPAHGVEYSVKVTQIGGLHDGDHLTRRVTIGTDFVSLVTLVRGGEAKTYKARVNQPPPAGGAVYPKQNLEDYFAYFRWDSGEVLRPPRPVLYFFTASDPTADELAKRPSGHAPMKWDAVREFSLQAPARSAAGSVPIYHDFIWDDDPCLVPDCPRTLKRPEFSAGVVIVHIVNPPGQEKASSSPPTEENDSPTEGESSPALTGLTVAAVTGEPTRLTVNWNAVESATKYSVRWKTGSDDYGDAVETTKNGYTITGLTAGTNYTVNVAALDASNTLLAESTADGSTEPGTGESRLGQTDETGDSDERQTDSTPAVSFMIYHDPNAGDVAVDRYNQAVELLDNAGIAYSVVSGDVQDEASRLAGVSNSVMPRFFLGDPTSQDWVSEPRGNNGGLRWFKQKVAELSGD